MNPPLRSAADRDAMIEAILDGVVDAIATDHAPHAMHEKEVEFENAPNGITGLETALGLSLRWLHKEWKMPLGRVLSLLSAQPAALLGLKGRGTLPWAALPTWWSSIPRPSGPTAPRESKSKAKQHAVRRLDDAGQSPLDHQRRSFCETVKLWNVSC
jgi:dihydroorotase